jgi:hypothetical protein
MPCSARIPGVDGYTPFVVAHPRVLLGLAALLCALASPSPVTAQEPAGAGTEPPKPAAPAENAPKLEKPYRPYAGHDLRKVVTLRETKDGQRTADLDLERIAAVLDDLEIHAKNYPPQFRGKDELELARRDARKLGELLGTVLAPRAGAVEHPVNVLLLAGRLEAIGHNLDVDGASTRAVGYYERLLKVEPEHVAANFHFGAFLAGTAALQKRALPHLEKAVKLGEKQALWPMALVHLMGGDMQKGVESLRAYVAAFPGDASAQELLQKIEKGEVTIERKVSEPSGK